MDKTCLYWTCFNTNYTKAKDFIDRSNLFVLNFPLILATQSEVFYIMPLLLFFISNYHICQPWIKWQLAIKHYHLVLYYCCSMSTTKSHEIFRNVFLGLEKPSRYLSYETNNEAKVLYQYLSKATFWPLQVLMICNLLPFGFSFLWL